MGIRTAINALISLLPYLIGLWFGTSYYAGQPSISDIERYLGFLCLFGSFNLLITYSTHYLRQNEFYTRHKNKSSSRIPSFLWGITWLAAIVAFAITFLIFIHFAYKRMERSLFHLLLVLLGVKLVIVWSRAIFKPVLSVLLIVIYICFIGYSSFVLVTGQWSLQALLVSFAFSLFYGAREVGSIYYSSVLLIKRYGKQKQRFQKIISLISKSYLFFIAGAPLLTIFLIFLGELPPPYFVALVPLVFIQKAKEELLVLNSSLLKKRELGRKSVLSLQLITNVIISAYTCLISLQGVFFSP